MEETRFGEYVSFTFFKADLAWRRLPKEVKEDGVGEFLKVLEGHHGQVVIRPYSTIGMRADTDFLLWLSSRELRAIQGLIADLRKTGLGAYLNTPYAYLAMTRESVYLKDHKHSPFVTIEPGQGEYLFVYPFVKTTDWYLLPFEERQQMMNEHFKVGHEFPTIRINTTYSFGLDDQEFVLAFESDSPSDFLKLVMRLRETQARRYTLRDTPIFTCVKGPVEEILRSLG
jgi:chlorite dismutase